MYIMYLPYVFSCQANTFLCLSMKIKKALTIPPFGCKARPKTFQIHFKVILKGFINVVQSRFCDIEIKPLIYIARLP